MRKLRRNWSAKKSDITRSINRIRSRHSRCRGGEEAIATLYCISQIIVASNYYFMRLKKQISFFSCFAGGNARFFSFSDYFVFRPSFLTNSSDLVFRDALRRKSAPAFVNPSSSSSSAAAAAAEKVLGLAAEATSAQQTSETSDPNTMFYITLNIEGVDEEEEEEEEEEEGGERREVAHLIQFSMWEV